MDSDRDEKPAVIAEKSPCGKFVRYKKILGRGAFKKVYKGFDYSSNTEIAWYQISVAEKDEKTSKPSNNYEKTICSEAVLLKSLNHPNIMKCHSFWFDHLNRKAVNMITELFPAGSLRHHTKKLGGIDTPAIKTYGRQILQALHHLHTRNPKIVHRDIKSDNIFVDNNGVVKIGDFGLAAAMEEGGPLRAFAGTPEFMAPEYYDEEYNELVDIYAFGLCLMEMAICECPYSECTNPAQIFKKVISDVKPPALERVQDSDVKEIIEKCLLPVSLRPSAVELLKDPFFSSSRTEEAMEEEECSGMLRSDSEVSTIGGEDSMEDLILSDLRTLYDDMSLGEVACCVGKLESSFGDCSMNSRVTYASSSDAVSKELCFIV